jgi:hypothetical protein
VVRLCGTLTAEHTVCGSRHFLKIAVVG